MNYCDPKTVLSPRDFTHEDVHVVFNGGEANYSICILFWGTKDEFENSKGFSSGNYRVGIRWNGGSNEKEGYTVSNLPKSSRWPVWFVLPDPIGVSELKRMLKDNSLKDRIDEPTIRRYLLEISK